MKIPDYRSASDRRAHGMDSYLDHFITEFQPVPPEAEDFREALQNVIDEVEWRMIMEERRRTAERRFNLCISAVIMLAISLLAIHHIVQVVNAYQKPAQQGAEPSDVQNKSPEKNQETR